MVLVCGEIDIYPRNLAAQDDTGHEFVVQAHSPVNTRPRRSAAEPGGVSSKLVLSVIVASRRAQMSRVQATVKIDRRRLKPAFRMQAIDCFPRDRCVGSEAIASGSSGGDPCRRISPDGFEGTMANSQRVSHAAKSHEVWRKLRVPRPNERSLFRPSLVHLNHRIAIKCVGEQFREAMLEFRRSLGSAGQAE